MRFCAHRVLFLLCSGIDKTIGSGPDILYYETNRRCRWRHGCSTKLQATTTHLSVSWRASSGHEVTATGTATYEVVLGVAALTRLQTLPTATENTVIARNCCQNIAGTACPGSKTDSKRSNVSSMQTGEIKCAHRIVVIPEDDLSFHTEYVSRMFSLWRLFFKIA